MARPRPYALPATTKTRPVGAEVIEAFETKWVERSHLLSCSLQLEI